MEHLFVYYAFGYITFVWSIYACQLFSHCSVISLDYSIIKTDQTEHVNEYVWDRVRQLGMDADRVTRLPSSRLVKLIVLIALSISSCLCTVQMFMTAFILGCHELI